jgi:hypothetical protein
VIDFEVVRRSPQLISGIPVAEGQPVGRVRGVAGAAGRSFGFGAYGERTSRHGARGGGGGLGGGPISSGMCSTVCRPANRPWIMSVTPAPKAADDAIMISSCDIFSASPILLRASLLACCERY